MNDLRPDEQVVPLLTAINLTLHAEMALDERVLVLGGRGTVSGGTFGATGGLLDAFGKARVFDVVSSPEALLGASVGLSIGGLVPVAEVSCFGGVQRAIQQLAFQLGALRHRSRGRFPLGVTVRVPFGGTLGAFEGQLTNLAGVKVVAPATATDAKGLLTEAIRDPDPVVFLESVRGYATIAGPVPSGEHRVPFGQARWAVAGDDITIIAWGYQVELASRVARKLATEGLSVGVLDLRSLVPLDIAGIVRAVEQSGRVLVVEESVTTSGFGAEVIATINEEVFYSLEAPPLRVSAFDTPTPARLLADVHLPDARIEAAVRRLLEAKA